MIERVKLFIANAALFVADVCEAIVIASLNRGLRASGAVEKPGENPSKAPRVVIESLRPR